MAGLAKMDNSEDESSQVKLFYFQEYPTPTLVGSDFPWRLKSRFNEIWLDMIWFDGIWYDEIATLTHTEYQSQPGFELDIH